MVADLEAQSFHVVFPLFLSHLGGSLVPYMNRFSSPTCLPPSCIASCSGSEMQIFPLAAPKRNAHFTSMITMILEPDEELATSDNKSRNPTKGGVPANKSSFLVVANS